jgi:hypothetical protein
MVDHQRAGWARVRVRRVVMRIFRRKIAPSHLNVSASALRRQVTWGQLRVAAGNRGHHRGCVVRSRRRLRADLLAKRVARDNQVRALINPAGRRDLECPLQVSAPQTSRRVERKSQRKRRHHQGHNSFGAIFTAAPEKNSGAAFLSECEVRVIPRALENASRRRCHLHTRLGRCPRLIEAERRWR